jgi:homoserine kinase
VTAEVVVEVPATSANLGPGFDSLGLALAVVDRVHARFVPGSAVTVEVVGQGAGTVATDASNLVARVVRTGLAAFDESGELAGRGLALRCENAVPHGRGLGSSAAAIVGALAVAAHLADVADAVSSAELVALATRLEGHPDNVAPAVLGGATVAWLETGEVGPVGRAVRLAVHPDVTPVLAIPEQECATERARGALPTRVAHADAVFNVARAALLVHALASDPALLLEATDDRLHQPQRRSVYPAALGLVEAVRDARIPAAVSGAGPSVIAFAVGDPAPVVARLAELAGPAWQVRAVPVAARGVWAR